MGMTRFSPGSRVKRTAMAPANDSSLLVQESSAVGEPAVFGKWFPDVFAVAGLGAKVV